MSGNLFDELKRRKVFKVGAPTWWSRGWPCRARASASPPSRRRRGRCACSSWSRCSAFPVALVMAWVFEATPDGVRMDPVRSGTKRVVAVAVALAALAVAWFFYGQASVHPGEQVVPVAAASTTPSPQAPAPAADPKSIAVLAFTDLSPKHDQDYFSDGVSEEILNALVRVQDLKVAGAPAASTTRAATRTCAASARRWAWRTCSRAACARRASACASPRS
jgi:hypothetical protein